MSATIKKCFILIFALTITCFSFANIVFAESGSFTVGDYFVIGQYNSDPVLWRYVADDSNGRLFVSDKVISFKRFNSPDKNADYHTYSSWERINYWKTSNLRAWLNSSAPAGEVIWLNNNPPNAFRSYIGYANEAGFLSDSNFTQTERNMMKSVTQWTMLPPNGFGGGESENGLTQRYSAVKEQKQGSGTGRDGTEIIFVLYDISELPTAYYGAAFQTNDSVFLLDELQLYDIWKNFDRVNAIRTAESKPTDPTLGQSENYILRGGFTAWAGGHYDRSDASAVTGVRPAFYLNEMAIGDVTGSGAVDDPYILTQNCEYVSVLKDGQTVTFDVAPVIENDRVLVPFRAIFEAFGAKVSWDGDTSTVTATTENTTLTMQIGNDKIAINGKTVTIDFPPQIVDDRTLVPIRVVSEGLGADVQLDDIDKTVIITSK